MSFLVGPSAIAIPALRNNANGCKIDCGSAAMLDNLATKTLMFCIRNSSTATGRVLTKKHTGATGGWDVDTTDTTGNFRYFNSRATTNCIYTTSGNPLLPINTWKLLAITVDRAAGAGLIVRIYRGDLLSPATEVAYATQTDGTGTFADESAQNFMLGGDGAFGIVGDLGPAILSNRILLLADIRDWQFKVMAQPSGTVGAWWPGTEGTGIVLDRSGNGNHGTITSMIPVSGLTLRVASRLRSLAFSASMSTPTPITPVFCCGAECEDTGVGAAPGSGILRHWDALQGAAPTIVTGRRAGKAYHFVGAAAANYLQRTLVGSPTTYVARMAFKFPTALPDINCTILTFHTNAGSFPNLRFRVATGDVIPGIGTTVTGATPFVVTPGVWYIVTMKFDVGSASRTCSAQIKAEGQSTYTNLGTAATAVAASSFDTMRVGFASGGEAATGSVDIDDILLSATPNDYPLPDGAIFGLLPVADGTHSFNNVTDFKYEDVTNMPSTTPTDTWSHLVSPLDSIAQFLSIAGAAAGEYLEWLLDKLPVTVVAVNGVEVVSSHFAAGTAANKVTLRGVDAAAATLDFISDGDQSQTTVVYSSKHFCTKFSGGPLDPAYINGLKFRLTSSFGSADISPVPYLAGLRMEVDCILGAHPAVAVYSQAIRRASSY